jgi:hypothetical protein
MGEAIVDVVAYALEESKQHIFSRSVYEVEVTLSFHVALALFAPFA